MTESLQLIQGIENLPIFFSQVREDPLLDLKVINNLSARKTKVLMIASGGETLALHEKLDVQHADDFFSVS